MRRFVVYGPALVVLVTVLAAMVAIPSIVSRASFAEQKARVVLARQTIADDDILARIDRAQVAVAEAVEPSVVHIDVEGGGAGASGSGWVYDERGHIVTNAHVVRSARRITVQAYDGRRADARVLGTDHFTDIAVLKLDGLSGLIAARRATGEIPRQGQQVFAFGSPFGFKFSMSRGIVSGLGRDPTAAVEVGGFTNFIQTDAAVNPGNSGGPLVDIFGRVIGMNTAIATGRETQGTREGQSAGISFAIPLAMIEPVVDQIIDSGRVSRGYLGISLGGRASVEIDQVGFRGTGFRIPDLVDGPAKTAGLRSGDVIVEINGQRVRDREALRAIISSTRAGQQVPVRVWRNDELITVQVTVGEMTHERLSMQAVGGVLASLGMGVEDGRAGPEVGEVRGWVPTTAGFERGQVITAVNGRPVSSFEQLCVELVDARFLAGEIVTVRVLPHDGPARDIEFSIMSRR